MSVSFPEVEAWDGNIECVSFPADLDGRRIRCLISWEALQDNFGGNQMHPIECFRQSRGFIEAKAANLLAQGRFERDGSILIRSSDGA